MVGDMRVWRGGDGPQKAEDLHSRCTWLQRGATSLVSVFPVTGARTWLDVLVVDQRVSYTR